MIGPKMGPKHFLTEKYTKPDFNISFILQKQWLKAKEDVETRKKE